MNEQIRISTYLDQSCCLSSLWSPTTNDNVVSNKKDKSSNMLQKNYKDNIKSKSQIKTVINIVKNKLNPNFTKYLDIAKKNQHIQKKEKINHIQQSALKNINLIKKTIKPKIELSLAKPSIITETNATQKIAFENSENHIIYNSGTKNSCDQFFNIYKESKSFMLTSKNFLDKNNSIQETNIIENYNNCSPIPNQINPFNSHQYNITDSISNMLLFTPREQLDQNNSSHIEIKKLVSECMNKEENNYLTIQNSNDKKNIWNFKQIRTIVSSKNQNSSLDKSEVVGKYPGRITSLDMRKNLGQNLKESQSEKYHSNIKKKQQMIPRSYQKIFYSKQDSQQSSKKEIAIQILNQSFTSTKTNMNENYQKCECVLDEIYQKYYIIKEIKSNKYFYLEQIFKQKLCNTLQRSQFQRQINTTIKLNHNNIMKFYELYEEEDKYCLIYELYDTNLETILQKQEKIQQFIAIQYLRDIIEGLQYLHSNNIVHRSIIPKNIVLIDNKCKISNFRKSLSYEEVKIYQQSSYTPPEFSRYLSLNFKIDCWAVGIIAHELVFGKIPIFSSQNKLIFDEKVPISKSYKKLIFELLEVDENKRISMKQALCSQCFA